MTRFTALSLGWGVQSWTLVGMVAFGELPPIDAAIHADTTHERGATYDFARRWTPWLKERGVKVVTVVPPDSGVTDNYGGMMLPAYMWKDDKPAQFSRQCTQNWKRAPVRRWLQANRNGLPVEMWLGISLDEYQRMKDSDVKYIGHRWPLIEKRMTRQDCVKWLQFHGLEVPPKSSCVFCPYHSIAGWRDVKQSAEDWQKAVDVDKAIRKARPPYDLFVHNARIPLEEVDLRTPQEKGQLELWADTDAECGGVCFV